MEPQHSSILAKHSLEKANKTLEEAYKNLDISLSIAQSRAYYSIYFIVLALGYLDGLVSSKHHQLMGWFNKNYIYENKTFDSSLTKTYSRLIRNREFFDYSITEEPIKENVVEDIHDAKTFIDTVKPYILQKLKSNNE